MISEVQSLVLTRIKQLLAPQPSNRPAAETAQAQTEPALAELPGAPTAQEPARFLGSEKLHRHVLFTWELATGAIVGLLHDGEQFSSPPRWAAHEHPELRYAVSTRSIEDSTGPELFDLASPKRSGEFAGRSWRELARVLGQPVPYWPRGTRYPDRMLDWRPGSPRLIVPVLPWLDRDPLLQLAAHLPEGSTLRRLLELNYSAHLRGEAQGSRSFVGWITGDPEFNDAHHPHSPHKLTEREIALPAVARHVAEPPSPRDAGITTTAERAAWLELLDFDDVLAEDVVRLCSDTLTYFPWAFRETITTEHGFAGREWIGKLVPTRLTRGTLGYFGPSDEHCPITGTYTEPVTGAPVVAYDDPVTGLTYVTPKPKRLATTSPLAEVILEDTVWIRTQDGGLHLCPTADDGPTWGYEGTGPGICATTVGRLLEDISAEAAGVSGFKEEDSGLYALFSSGVTEQGHHVLTRQQLLDACTGDR